MEIIKSARNGEQVKKEVIRKRVERVNRTIIGAVNRIEHAWRKLDFYVPALAAELVDRASGFQVNALPFAGHNALANLLGSLFLLGHDVRVVELL